MRGLARQTRLRLSCLLALAPRLRALVRRLRASSLALALAVTLAATPAGGTLESVSHARAGAGMAAVSTLAPEQVQSAPGTAHEVGDYQAAGAGAGAGAGVFPSHVTATASLRSDRARDGMVQASGVADSSPARLASAARVSSGPASKPGSLGLELPSRMGSGRTRAVAMVSNTASPDNPLESASVFAKRVLELGKEGILELREDVQGRWCVRSPATNRATRS